MKESKGTRAAKKAWRTIKANEAQMSPKELQELRERRSQWARKAAATRRARRLAEQPLPPEKEMDKQFCETLARLRPEWIASRKFVPSQQRAAWLDEHVRKAEKLAEQHGGVLPSRTELERLGKRSLALALDTLCACRS